MLDEMTWRNASKIAISLSKFGFTKRKINISTFKIVCTSFHIPKIKKIMKRFARSLSQT